MPAPPPHEGLGCEVKVEAEKHLKEILVTNERGDCKEYVMHGSNLKGIVFTLLTFPLLLLYNFIKLILYKTSHFTFHIKNRVRWVSFTYLVGNKKKIIPTR